MQVKGIFSYINERGTSLIVNTSTCWKMELHLSNLVVLCCLLHRGPTEIHGFNNNIDMVNTLRFLVLSQFFCRQYGSLEGLGDILLPNFSALHCSLDLCHSTSWSYFFLWLTMLVYIAKSQPRSML